MTLETRILEIDPSGQRREDFHYDHATGTTIITETEDLQYLISALKANHDYTPDKHGRWKGDAVKVGSIPVTMLYELMQAGIVDKQFRADEKKLQAWFNEHSKLKATPGRFA
jgi:hypothetical protein